MKGFRDHGGLLESVVILFIMLFTFAVPEPTKAVSDDSHVSYDIVDVASDTESIDNIEKIETAELASDFEYTSYSSYSALRYSAPRSNYISILGRTINLFVSNNTQIDAGSMVARYIKGTDYPGKFYYGHNSSWVFGGLASLYAGSTFVINLDGIDYNYRVAKVETVENDKNLASNMTKIASGKDFYGNQYDVTLMTCAGKPYGEGNATQRVIVYAYLY